jgi:uncharacterized membrane protein YbaN (DUF454 family)
MAQVGPMDVTRERGLSGSRSRRWVFVAIGHGFVALGVIGAFVPLMPTTIFLILAASCYAKGSVRLHQKLMSHRTFGPALRNWEQHHAMSVRAKTAAITAIVVSFAIGFVFIPLWWIRVIHVSIGLALVTWIARIRTTRSR